MFNQKQLYLIGALAMILSLVLVQVQVRAAWTGPGVAPGSSGTTELITNPLTNDLHLNSKNLTNGAAGSFTSLNLNSGDLTNVDNINLNTINGVAPGGGGVSNPLTASLSGNNLYGIVSLKGCDPAAGATCGAVEGQAGRSTRANTFAFGVYGYTQALSSSNPSYGVYGLAQNLAGVGVYGYATEKNAYGVYGAARDKDGIGGAFTNSAVGGKALVATGATQLNGNLNVIGNADVSNSLNVNQDATVSGNMVVTGTTLLEGLVNIDNGVTVEGIMRVDSSPVSTFSAIVGKANGLTYAQNAGVEGIGTVGVYGNGSLVGVYADSPGYGGIFKGSTAIGWNPPGGGVGPGNDTPPEGNIFSRLFGLEKTFAVGLDTPGPVGLVAAGGFEYSGGFNRAGLGICALSGEKSYAADTGGGDFYEYCQDNIGSGTNNYAGFFAGDVYFKEGSLQINDSLAANNENLIYANAASAFAGSHLLKLQTAGADKFLVDQEGNTTVILPASGSTLGDGIKVTRGTGRFLMGQGTNNNNTDFVPILSAKPVGNSSFMIRGIQSDLQTTAEAFRFSATNSSENGAMPGNELAMTFYNWANPLMAIMGDGTVGIGTITPNSAYKLNVVGSINSTGSYYMNGTAGMTSSISVRNAAGTGSCTMTIRGGLVTATTCP